MLLALAVILSLISPAKQAFAQWPDIFAPVVTQPTPQVEPEKVSVKKKYSRRVRKSRRYRYRSSNKITKQVTIPTPAPVKEPDTFPIIIQVPEEPKVPLIDRFSVFVEPVFVKPVDYKKPEVPNNGWLVVTTVCLSIVSFLAILLFVSYRFNHNK